MAKKPFNLANNPLVNPPATANGTPPFQQVKTEHFLPAIEWGLKKAKADIKAITDNTDAPTFENTIEALEFAGEELGQVLSVFSTVAGSKADDDVRKLRQTVSPMLSSYGNDITFNEELFKRVKAVYDDRANLSLSKEQTMLLENAYRGFEKNGALLSDADKQKLRDISQKMSLATTTFSQNTVKSTEEYQKVISDENDLAGVPQRAKNQYKQAAVDAGMPDKWLIRLEPMPVDIMSHADNRDLRREIQNALNNVANNGDQYDNSDVVLEIVKLRDEKAKLLGYPNYAEFVLSDQMAGSAQTVFDFLEKNRQAYMKAAVEELKEIKAYALKEDGLAEKDFDSWDLGYYERKLKEEKFDLDTEELRPYFELNNVLDGLFDHAEKLFDIRMDKAPAGKYETLYPDTLAYDVFDKKTGDQIGVFYSDNFARPGQKGSGAWMSAIRSRGDDASGVNQIPVITNNCNFAKPTATQPTLLSLREVETLFHEFGHGLHGLLAKGKYSSLTGTSVKRDFVELPSQLQENWVSEKSVLQSFAKHYQTGKPIPDNLIQKMKDARAFGAGNAGLRQTFFGLLDMVWHTVDPSTISSVEDLEDKVRAKASLFDRKAGTMSTSFGHLFAGGYAAGYYGYKWAEVLDADVFDQFKQKGLYDRSTAESLRQNIYEKGGTEPPMRLFVDFMGREPDPEALFKREGLNDSAPKTAQQQRTPRKNGPSPS